MRIKDASDKVFLPLKEEQLTYGGDIKDFPIEVVEKMLERQVKQGNKRDVSVFERLSNAEYEGFNWKNTIEGFAFWINVISGKNFALFFEKYPKKEVLISENIRLSHDIADKIDELSNPILPQHYNVGDTYEPIKIIEHYNLNFAEGCCLKYLLRYKKKNGVEDLKKAAWYLDRLINQLENK
jgi:hypothetical protein